MSASGQSADELQKILRRRFGQRQFRSGQRELIEKVLAGRSALGLMPTGSGKSLTFQLPALLLARPVLVVSPLLALMEDQVTSLRARGIAAARIEASWGEAEIAKVLGAWERGELRLLFVSPERLARADFRGWLAQWPPGLIAVDEAHCLSTWGHHFRPDYLRLPLWCRSETALAGVPVLALTATAVPEVVRDSCEAFAIEDQDVVRLLPLRENLTFTVQGGSLKQRQGQLLRGLSGRSALPAIVYATRQEQTESLARFLREAGLEARAFHAGLRREARVEIAADFLQGRLKLVVATVAFGMGIDHPRIRRVIHWNLPASLEELMQQAGRAGRDGKAARSIVLADGADRVPLENFAWGNRPTRSVLAGLLEQLLRRGELVEVSPWELGRSLDLREEVLDTVLALLELRGLIEPLGVSYAGVRVRFRRGPEAVLAGLPKTRRALALALFVLMKSTRWGWELDWESASQKLEVAEDELRKMLDELAQHGELSLRPRGRRWRLARRRAVDGAELRELVAELDDHFGAIEAGQLARVGQVWDWCSGSGCLAQGLARHFDPDQSGEPCGKCSGCVARRKALVLKDSVVTELGAEQVAMLRELADEGHPALRGVPQLARFVAGIPSPAARAAGLHRDPRFGALAAVPFGLLLVYAGELCR